MCWNLDPQLKLHDGMTSSFNASAHVLSARQTAPIKLHTCASFNLPSRPYIGVICGLSHWIHKTRLIHSCHCWFKLQANSMCRSWHVVPHIQPHIQAFKPRRFVCTNLGPLTSHIFQSDNWHIVRGCCAQPSVSVTLDTTGITREYYLSKCLAQHLSWNAVERSGVVQSRLGAPSAQELPQKIPVTDQSLELGQELQHISTGYDSQDMYLADAFSWRTCDWGAFFRDITCWRLHNSWERDGWVKTDAAFKAGGHQCPQTVAVLVDCFKPGAQQQQT